jgi:hypothetical protein
VEAKARDKDGTAVAVIAGIGDVLKVERGKYAAPYVKRVVGFDDVLAAVVEAPVTEKKSFAAEREIIRVNHFPSQVFQSQQKNGALEGQSAVLNCIV